MSRILPHLLIVLSLVFGFAAVSDAQTLPGFGGSGSGSESSESDLSAAIRQAAESGVNVIVLDGNGKLVAAAAPSDTPGTAASPKGTAMDHASPLMQMQSEVNQFRETLANRLAALPNSVNEVTFILRATSPDGEISTYLRVLMMSLGLLIVGWLVTREIYGKHIARKFVVSRILEHPQGYRDKMPFLVFRFVMGVVGTLLAMLVAFLIGTLFFREEPDQSIQLTVAAIFLTIFLARTLSDLWRMVLSPFLPQYRIPVLSDKEALRLYRWAVILGSYSIAAIMFSTWIADFGLNYNVYAILSGALELVAALGNIAMILFNRNAISNAIRGGRKANEVSWLIRTLSVAWAPVLIGYVIFGWFELAFDLVLERNESIPLVAGAYAVFLSIIVVYGGINYLIERLFERIRHVEHVNSELAAAEALEAAAEQPDDAEPTSGLAPTQHIMTYEALARRVAGILAFVAGAYALLRVWDPENRLLPDSAIERLLDVVTILFIGYIVYNFFRIWIDSKIAEETVDETEAELGDEGGAGSASRLATLLPLFRGAILAIVLVSIALIALLELGINVSPLFAGAGVVGLAVGFGAQTLVRDIFSGAFFLIDDAFRKGEYIDIGDVKGTVEKISVRSFQLRHHLGALNTIPFGEIKVLTNYSRDWVIMKLPLRVTYDTDVEKVRKLIKKLGQELLEDPVIGDNFIQPLKSQGVIEMQDSAMIIRVKFMTKPGDQWLVRKRVYEEIRALFAREGIHFAHREVTVRLADANPNDLTPAQKEAVAGAARGVIDDDFMDDAGPEGDDR
ncbi:mechanosensitive ion channel family protein [Sedimentitalea sp. XS_ASV28]|uniref:mechanosensitive ion channel family protein n=1 Tax=Sedimentitalea sp. XS_ASV28 TaxID=3241296 RepID=UPI003513B56E